MPEFTAFTFEGGLSSLTTNWSLFYLSLLLVGPNKQFVNVKEGFLKLLRVVFYCILADILSSKQLTDLFRK